MGSSHSSKAQPISDDDIKKYTGKTRDELATWADSRPGVGKNQLAGKLALGSAMSGVAAGEGCGGWGPGAEPSGADRGMKFPPRPETNSAREK
ncbi:hypothetical protein CDD80_4369 [Ophiocordyceps camponoti-rufipedis]|uniref:Uncharacterized protein n=1 Tax=Ophiocordyceps camponoti-rufipedis TaxID=2004952 RepID=A0A2C5ZF03_9HYPO|nr:hypothetical protein CDD80_4369 [Ophiocordyceps camponoti-rufipedis]